MTKLPVSFDHSIVRTSDWERARAFYVDVIGATAVERRVGYSFRLGDTQINCQGPETVGDPLPRVHIAAGNSELCFRWAGPIDDAVKHLQRHGVAVVQGPVQRFGTRGRGTSVYFRDPDGSLMEFISYHE